MNIGVSSASLYPMHTEDALLKLGEVGVKNAEIFMNCSFEFDGEIFESIKRAVNDYGINVISAHPFSSPMESLYLFSSYDRRVQEMLDLYKRFFEKMNILGARIFVIHGAIASAKCSNERYIEKLYRLIEIGKSMNVIVAQENVCYCKSGKIAFLEMLSKTLGDEIKFVLDIKQARRSGYSPYALLDLLGNKIVHLHLSDSEQSGERDCLPIGKGDFDFGKFFERLKETGYGGGAVVELYRENYGEYEELFQSVENLEKISKYI